MSSLKIHRNKITNDFIGTVHYKGVHEYKPLLSFGNHKGYIIMCVNQILRLSYINGILSIRTNDYLFYIDYNDYLEDGQKIYNILQQIMDRILKNITINKCNYEISYSKNIKFEDYFF